MRTWKECGQAGTEFWAVDIYRRPGAAVRRYYVIAEDRLGAARIAGREHARRIGARLGAVEQDTGPAHYYLLTSRGAYRAAVDWQVNHPYGGGRYYLTDTGPVHVW